MTRKGGLEVDNYRVNAEWYPNHITEVLLYKFDDAVDMDYAANTP